ncbi:MULTISPECIES: 3-hydroxy-9,10-secoandrosta-1,3,5(10)-triene-9,17-dione monooxygenase oxygenase subunit [unclassified Streptomyces]|uniref:3-hydroxy-9,10-secoandrosta-1,3,5(10)-triene-9, 17-dione monooxygenase oxygenase subunit n=1 Tax=unclassified Streptomyces TaxID=2593676 RepID=UPI00225246F4|nr:MULTISPECIES: 3-hydroxy-9,10-secoandrosta-1,3,5(10)-triene-9,17-dione monooxygenase oxygenase subunit [unclassified Streptomyces]WSP59140.1 flavin-dependent monooxygenase [Streptomyces sp. NBC_01241]WSU20338.1 flavin-dependent monooxygenase [Streptomyces sp. NBC_01108]MCX4790883.1 flavin-dependent monooxygenase [Streptomyces sp. NBC_01221]MCX4793387.1 flavin-dependent monooxygenase [Streptomyces sp. NBC_01242]WSJ34824.1 flavin-dependent monooxygenase [Streptomyces sp. NBC_01321]
MGNEVLESVRALLPAIAERARNTDESRQVPEKTIRELVDAGVFRMLQPRRYGGLEGDPVDFYEVVRAISAVCCSTGWVASVLGVHPWQLGLFDRQAQDEVWGEDQDTLVSSAYAPVGRLTPVEGGYRLSGRWSFSSGCGHAAWALLGALVVGAHGRPVDFMTVLVPRCDYRIEDVWDVVGLRGTASNDIVVEPVFVPAHRVIRNYEQAQLKGPGQKVNPGPLYRLPFGAVFTSAITAPVIGAVAGGYDAYISSMKERVRLSLGGGRFVEDPFAQVAIARAASDLDATLLQMDRNLRELSALAEEGREIPMELRLRTRRDQVRGTERAVAAMDLLFKTAGGNSLRRGNPIERAWRDAHAGSVHVANDVERALAMYGRGAFGLTVEDNLV